ncbi:hypothetical protein KM043_017392 [Ampulex compressa]|nr:hypothetical protein KM043_017392 [Ampulex compressa]
MKPQSLNEEHQNGILGGGTSKIDTSWIPEVATETEVPCDTLLYLLGERHGEYPLHSSLANLFKRERARGSNQRQKGLRKKRKTKKKEQEAQRYEEEKRWTCQRGARNRTDIEKARMKKDQSEGQRSAGRKEQGVKKRRTLFQPESAMEKGFERRDACPSISRYQERAAARPWQWNVAACDPRNTGDPFRPFDFPGQQSLLDDISSTVKIVSQPRNRSFGKIFCPLFRCGESLAFTPGSEPGSRLNDRSFLRGESGSGNFHLLAAPRPSPLLRLCHGDGVCAVRALCSGKNKKEASCDIFAGSTATRPVASS